MRREIVLDRLEIDAVDLWVVFDEQGQSNFQACAGLHRSAAASLSIIRDWPVANDSAVHFIDRKRDLQGDLRDLTEKRARSNADPPEVGVRLAREKARLSTTVTKWRSNRSNSSGGMESGAEIERLKLQSPVAEMTASGRLDDWRSPRYQLDARAWAWLEDVFALFAPAGTAPGGMPGYRYRYRTRRHDTGSGSDRLCSRHAPKFSLKGLTSFNGRIEGEGAAGAPAGKRAPTNWPRTASPSATRS